MSSGMRVGVSSGAATETRRATDAGATVDTTDTMQA